ncbi:unnamed protein product [Pleuronectes platessa]|uniref:Uncharacterized protein n=1 Tax=Pleuronectes platessa TaxID=8262 RepID=A0A9N7Z437_PLEPL|nr:unnamed protein product [Pleuronectes platessa]
MEIWVGGGGAYWAFLCSSSKMKKQEVAQKVNNVLNGADTKAWNLHPHPPGWHGSAPVDNGHGAQRALDRPPCFTYLLNSKKVKFGLAQCEIDLRTSLDGGFARISHISGHSTVTVKDEGPCVRAAPRHGKPEAQSRSSRPQHGALRAGCGPSSELHVTARKEAAQWGGSKLTLSSPRADSSPNPLELAGGSGSH